MAKFTILKNKFTSGELSEKLKHRIDSQEWQNGLARIDNFIPMKEGGAKFRPGLYFECDVSTYGDGCILPFITNRKETFLIYICPTASNQLSFFNPSNGSFGAIDVVSYLPTTGIDHRLDPKGFRFSQKHDVMIVTHTSSAMCPFIIYRNEVGDFYWNYWKDIAGFYFYSKVNRQLTVPYTPENFNGETCLKPNAITGSTTLTATNSTGAFPIHYFTPRHIGKWYRIIHGTTEGSCLVTDVPALKQTITGINYSTNTFTLGTHGFSTGDKVFLLGVGAPNLPNPLASVDVCRDPYFIIKVDNDNFKLASTSDDATAGTEIDIRNNGFTGTMFIYRDGADVNCDIAISETFGGTFPTDNWRESAMDSHKGYPKLSTFFENRSYFFSTLADKD
jgi:hypothetical protein